MDGANHENESGLNTMVGPMIKYSEIAKWSTVSEQVFGPNVSTQLAHNRSSYPIIAGKNLDDSGIDWVCVTEETPVSLVPLWAN